MFAVGHVALGYIFGKATSKFLNVDLNIPLVFVASVISDIDLLIPGLEHRGPTHSLILIFLFSFPAFALYGRRVAPFFVAVVQHFVIGDYLTGDGVQLLRPLTSYWYGVEIAIMSLTNILVEWTLFLMFLMIMFRTKDVWFLFQHHASNMLLFIPIFTILLPTVLSFPLSVPLELIVPHIVYLVLFAFAILVDFQHVLKKSLY